MGGTFVCCTTENTSPGEVLLAEQAHQHQRDLLRGAAVRDQLAEHGADAHDAQQSAQDVADALFEHARHLVHGQPQQDRRDRRGHQECEERLDLAPADEQYQQDDGREDVPDFHAAVPLEESCS
jgi:hypothetical protein